MPALHAIRRWIENVTVLLFYQNSKIIENLLQRHSNYKSREKSTYYMNNIGI